MDRVSDRRKEKERDRDHHHRSRPDVSPDTNRESVDRDRDRDSLERESRARSSRKRKDHHEEDEDDDRRRRWRRFEEDWEEKKVMVKEEEVAEGLSDGEGRKARRREGRRFSAGVKEEDRGKDRGFMDKVKEEEEEESGSPYEAKREFGNGDRKKGVSDKALVQEPLSVASEVSMTPSSSSSVSSITTTENEGVSIIGSDEVHGKSSTDGTAVDKSGYFSLDALAKAKKALQKHKEISEKLKKLNKITSSSSEKNLQVASGKDAHKAPPSLGVGTPSAAPTQATIGEKVFKEKNKGVIPEIEWWDKQLLSSGTYTDDSEPKLNVDKITIYVEHPRPIEPPAEPAAPPPQPLKLTKKEQKKLRTQRRLAKEKDRQEMIRQGLLEPPKAKIKMSNLMKVLGSEATQDPTRLEMEIRSAAAEREQAHVDRNIARKLTPAERREKKEKKLFEDPTTLETLVSVYKIKDLSHPQTRFKVDVNAQENRLTGCTVISDGISVVVVEGGKKSIKRYGKLMLKRINWAAAVSTEEDVAENAEAPINSCVLAWQGSVAKPSFNRFLVHQCRSDAPARKVFADAGVPHYWDLAVNFSDEL